MKYYGLMCGSKVVTDKQGLPRAWYSRARAKLDKKSYEQILGVRLKISQIQLYHVPDGYRLEV